MERFALTSILFLVVLTSCASKPKVPDSMLDIPVESGELVSSDNPYSTVEYLITDAGNNQSGDFIIFLHGASWDHRQWLKEGGIYDQYRQACRLAGTEPLPAVSLHFAPYYFIVDGAVTPTHADNLYSFYKNEIVPYFRDRLDCDGNIYLIGYSMGGHNALAMSVFEPELYKRVLLVSPMIIPDSPFNGNFIDLMTEATGRKQMARGFRQMLKNAYQTPENWNAHSAFVQFEESPERPYPSIYLTLSENDLDGFDISATRLVDLMEDNGIPFEFFIVPGDHTNPDVSEALLSFTEGILADMQ